MATAGALTPRQRWLLLTTGMVLVAMFTGAVATPRSDGDGVPAGGPLHWWGQRLAAATPVAPADLASDCLDSDGSLQFSGSCVVTVAATDDRRRTLTLHGTDAVSVTAPVPGGETTVSAHLEPGDAVDVTVGLEGAEILLRCRASGECVVTIGGGDDG
jgi:hypothetical protein